MFEIRKEGVCVCVCVCMREREKMCLLPGMTQEKWETASV